MKKILVISALILSFTACQNDQKKEVVSPQKENTEKTQSEKPSFDKEAYKKKGMMIAKSTFKAFGSHIQRVAKNGGLPVVVDFCHDSALKLTDSMGQVHHVAIKRTSHKLRNPANKPDIDEEAVINEYLKDLAQNKPLEPVILKDSEGYVHFYAPIKIKEGCIACHGKPGKEIPENIYKKIKEKYPNDQAVNFKVGDLRGIWDIKFPKK